MNLNDLDHIRAIDKERMIDHIDGLPEQLEAAYALGRSLPLPEWAGIRQVLVAGMGGSAIGADLLAAYAAPLGGAPILLHRDYDLPHWAQGKETLVICSSHSGNTEETLSAFEMAGQRGCRVLAVTTGGELARRAEAAGIPLWRFDYDSQPRAAIGYSFGLLLAAAARQGVLPDPAADLGNALAAMRKQRESLQAEVPDIHNSSKRMAGQFYGRWITVFGSGFLAPAARRWKAQINEHAKAQAAFEELPEACHNTLQGVEQPRKQYDHSMYIWLRSPLNHPRNQMRDEHTRVAMMVQGINTDFVMASGEGRLAHLWTLVQYGDYTAYYLAIAYGLDPTPVPMLVELKEKMGGV